MGASTLIPIEPIIFCHFIPKTVVGIFCELTTYHLEHPELAWLLDPMDELEELDMQIPDRRIQQLRQ